MNFKQAQLSQLKEIEQLYRKCAKIPNSSWNDEYPCWDFLWQDFQQQSLYVLMQQDQLIGVVSLLPVEDQLAWPIVGNNLKECCRLAIDPIYHRQGYGHQLGHFLIEEAKRQQLDGLVLLVAKQNTAALNLYQSLNFEIVLTTFQYEIDFWGLCLSLKQEKKEVLM